MTKADNKADRLLQIEALLLAHPEGLTQAEIARRLEVNRSTVSRYFRDMPYQFPYYEDEEGRLFIDRQSYLVNVRLNLHEAMTVHLAARLMATRMDKHNPHAAAALRKLSVALENLAPRISVHVNQSADVMDEPGQLLDRGFLDVLEKLTLAWAELRKVKVRHLSEKSGKVHEYLLCPYFIEPYAVGQTMHVIGRDVSSGKMRTLKLERIESVELTQESYEISADFDPRALLADAWGIWYTESEPVEVTLKFNPRVAHRVRETRWHRSQEVKELEDGSLLWKVRVAEPQEMIPWIRSWGADCEVVGPEAMRIRLAHEVKRLGQLYLGAGKGDKKIYYAHAKEGFDQSEWQLLIEHLTRTAEIAREFGRPAKIADLAYIAGLAHDLGKYSKEFQLRLMGSKTRVDHSTAGAKELIRLMNKTPLENYYARLLAFPITGHHSGLLDFGDSSDLPGDGTLTARLRTEICDFSAYTGEVDLENQSLPKQLHIRPLQLNRFPNRPSRDYTGYSLSFLTRMLYSALVDADFQETETYMQGKKPRGGHDEIPTLKDRMNAHLRRFDDPQTDINSKRNETLNTCVEKASEKPGFFTLTVPTGGGKTLASMAFALNHAALNGMRRVIYVIPYTTIIEQNAGVFKDIFGEENVLEHHSNFDWEQLRRSYHEIPDNSTNNAYAKLRLAAENWDIPIVVTTNVQFFESLFANKSSRCRKLHNIAQSVIIFDEAQMLPREYMFPAMSAVWELVVNYGASAVFCTATQPDLGRFLPEKTPLVELASNPQELFDFYRRVEVKNLGTLSDDKLLERLNTHPKVLCIVNTRRHASGLFHGLEGEGNFHLSTLMCPVHRKEKLTEIRQRLQPDNEQPCRVVSTSVMEAGIDLDFPVGYRAISGLDSINQAAGRVNRNMKHHSSEMFVFEPKSEFVKRTPRYISQSAEITRRVLREYSSAPISIPAIASYFEQLYSFQDPQSFDFKNILGCFDDMEGRFKFQTAARLFQIIEDETVTLIIPYNEEACALIEELKFTAFPSTTLRKLQTFTVSIYKSEFENLSTKGVILTIAETYAVLNTGYFHEYYHPETGLVIPASGGGDGLFF